MIGTIRRVLQEHTIHHHIIHTEDDHGLSEYRWYCNGCKEDIDPQSIIEHQARQIGFALLPIMDAYEEIGWDRAHKEAYNCESQSCDEVHGAEMADMNPFRKYNAQP